MSISAGPSVLLRRHLLAWPMAAALTSAASRSDAHAVVFIGDGPAEQFAPWQKFGAAAAALAQPWPEETRLSYLPCPVRDPAGKREAILAASQPARTVLVAPTGNSATMAVALARHTPVVFASFLDPIRAGFAASDRTPGGMATGVSLADWLDAKRLHALREAFPRIRRVGVLTDRSWAQHYQGEARVRADAQALGLQARFYIGNTADDIDALLSAPAAAQEDAWYVMPTNFAYVGEARIRAHLQRLGAPAMLSTAGEVERGGALAYVADAGFVYPKLAELVGRVIGGEAPGGIPIERPRRFLLVARADAHCQGRPISMRLLRRADRIV